MDARKVKIYTTPTCPFCVLAKGFLRTKGLNYEEKNIESDPKAREEVLELSGQLGVPVITIDSDVVVGFNQTMIESLITKN